jgi:hypothetical protein
MKHAEKVTPLAAALTSLATLVCCFPIGFAAAAATTSVGMVISTHQLWFLGASVVFLVIGLVQLRRVQRTCVRQPYSSIVIFSVSAVIVLLVTIFPQVVAGIMADWLP